MVAVGCSYGLMPAFKSSVQVGGRCAVDSRCPRRWACSAPEGGIRHIHLTHLLPGNLLRAAGGPTGPALPLRLAGRRPRLRARHGSFAAGPDLAATGWIPGRLSFRFLHIDHNTGMRVGHVTADGRARVRISVAGTAGANEEIDALLDTGFNGALANGGGPITCWWSGRSGAAFGPTTPDR